MDVEVWTNLPAVGASAVRRLRREEYDRLVDAGTFDREHVELIRGVIVRMSPQGASHAGPIQALTRLLVPALVGRADVRIQLPLIGPDDSEPEPDIAVVAPGDYFRAHPDRAHLVIEVARTSLTYDRGTKAPLYAEMGVAELWIVDVEGQAVEVHRDPRAGGYGTITTHRTPAVLPLLAFPDVTVALAELLR